jgi:hypothetical protein
LEAGLTPDTLYGWRARVLYAPYSITELDIIEPPNTTHGPWRRLSAQANEADIRVVPERNLLLALVSGFALIAVFNGRRRIRR